jgi:hypothetical protein
MPNERKHPSPKDLMDAKRAAASYVASRNLARVREPAPWAPGRDPFLVHMEQAKDYLDKAMALAGAKIALRYVKEAEAKRDRYLFDNPLKQQHRTRGRRR